jgi:hypothetical protein
VFRTIYPRDSVAIFTNPGSGNLQILNCINPICFHQQFSFNAIYALNNLAIKYNVKISVNKTKIMTMKGKIYVETKMVINIINLNK